MAVEKSYAPLGLFLVVGLVVVLATALFFIQRLRRREVITMVTYTRENVSGLEVSSPVRYRGVSLGRITDVRVDPRSNSIEVDFEVRDERHAIRPWLYFHDAQGQCLFATSDPHRHAAGAHRSTVEIPGNFLAEGLHSVDVVLATSVPMEVHVWERGLLTFQVTDSADGTTARGDWAGDLPGAVRPLLPWTTRKA